MRGLPYFKNYVDEYLTGDIRLCSYETQGVFAILKCLLWKKNGELPNNPDLISRISGIDITVLNRAITELYQYDILVITEHNSVIVKFILEQFQELEKEHNKKSEAGKKGMEHRWNKGVTKHNTDITPLSGPVITKHNNIDIDKEEDKDIKKVPKKAHTFKTYSLEDFQKEVSELAIKKNMPESMKVKFLKHWIEKSTSGMMKFQLEKTWETNLRMDKWISNQAQWDNKKTDKFAIGQIHHQEGDLPQWKK